MNNTTPEMVPDLQAYDDMAVENMARRLIADVQIVISKMEQHFIEEVSRSNPSSAATLEELTAQLKSAIQAIEFAYDKCVRCGDDINQAHYRGQDLAFSAGLQAELRHLEGQLQQRCWDLRGVYLELQSQVSHLDDEDNAVTISEV